MVGIPKKRVHYFEGLEAKSSMRETSPDFYELYFFQIANLLNDNISSTCFRNRFITSTIRVHYVEARVKMVTLGTRGEVSIIF